MKIIYLRTGGLFITIGIVLGAFGSHWLKSEISTESLESFKIGNQYLIYHGLALLFIGTTQKARNSFTLIFYRSILVGVLFFSGSIYFLSTASITHLPKIIFVPFTPLGGSILIISWIFFVLKCSSFVKD